LATTNQQHNPIHVYTVSSQGASTTFDVATRSEVRGAVTFRCRVTELKYDSETTVSSNTSSNGTTSTSSHTSHRVSFVAANVELISGDRKLFDSLPKQFFVVITPDKQPLLQWEGRDAEVTGTSYSGGVFTADSISIPELNYKVEKSNGNIVGFVIFMAILIIVFVGAIFFVNHT
jgi:hypothetical protein